MTEKDISPACRLTFFGVIQLTHLIRSMPFTTEFGVSRENKDAMPFLKAYACQINFKTATICMGTQGLYCNNGIGRRLWTLVHVTLLLLVPRRLQQMVLARMAIRNYYPTGLIEGDTELIPLATRVGSEDKRVRVEFHCLNTTDQPVWLKAGLVVGTYTAVDDADVGENIAECHCSGLFTRSSEEIVEWLKTEELTKNRSWRALKGEN